MVKKIQSTITQMIKGLARVYNTRHIRGTEGSGHVWLREKKIKNTIHQVPLLYKPY